MTAKLKVVRDTKGDDEPIDLYLKQVDEGTMQTLPYERLMIHYRKAKEYEKESAIIKKGIAALQQFYTNAQQQTLGKKVNPKIKALSKKIGKSVGLVDKKGNDVFLPEPLPKWIKETCNSSRKSQEEEKECEE